MLTILTALSDADTWHRDTLSKIRVCSSFLPWLRVTAWRVSGNWWTLARWLLAHGLLLQTRCWRRGCCSKQVLFRTGAATFVSCCVLGRVTEKMENDDAAEIVGATSGVAWRNWCRFVDEGARTICYRRQWLNDGVLITAWWTAWRIRDGCCRRDEERNCGGWTRVSSVLAWCFFAVASLIWCGRTMQKLLRRVRHDGSASVDASLMFWLFHCWMRGDALVARGGRKTCCW